jgi:hypothetical protein
MLHPSQHDNERVGVVLHIIGTKASHWRKVNRVEALSCGLDLDGPDTLQIGRQGMYDEVT